MTTPTTAAAARSWAHASRIPTPSGRASSRRTAGHRRAATNTSEAAGGHLAETSAAAHAQRVITRRRGRGRFRVRAVPPGLEADVAAAADAHPSVLSSLAKLAVGSATALFGSVALDEYLDRDGERVRALTNAETSDGVRMYVASPEQPADDASEPPPARPAVIVVHQFYGLRRREIDLCDELARLGYVAVAPDTFDGASTGWVPRAIKLVAGAALLPGATWGVPQLMSVVRWTAAEGARNFRVDARRVAVAGFCYGGGAALRLATAVAESDAAEPLKAVTVFYGKPPDEPEALAKIAAARTSVLGVYGTADKQFPPDAVDAFERGLAAAGVDGRVRRYEGEGHAFVADLAAVRAGGNAADAWGVFTRFLADKL